MKPEDDPACFSSPPCMMHEFEAGYSGVDDRTRLDVARWRKASREHLIGQRMRLSAERRDMLDRSVMARLRDELGELHGRTVSIFWPFKGESDPRALVVEIIAGGGACALPVVVEKAHPLAFHRWAPGEKLERGVWNIPVPAVADPCIPDIVLAPVVGFDALCFRLGYGGGYFDRTLAAMPAKPRVIGIGYEQARLSSIFPQPHDIPMDTIVTEADTYRRLDAAQ